jgi:signal transduction histidine kinase
MSAKTRFFTKFKNIVSLRFFITLIVIVAGVIPIIVMEHAVSYGYRNSSMKKVITDVKNYCNILSKDIAAGTYMTDQNSAIINAELEQLANVYSARIIIVDGSFTIIKDNYVFDEGKILISESVLNAYSGKVTSTYNIDRATAEVSLPIVGHDGDTLGVINMSLINHDMIEVMEYVDKIMNALKIGFLLLWIVIASLSSHVLVRPAIKMGKDIMGTTVGKNTKIDSQPLYEYRYIADSVNKMLERLNTIDSSRDEFVSDVSHELKTPMTSMKVLADSLLAQDNVPEEIYKDFLQDIVTEIDRENQIINNLLALVKTDRKNTELNITTVNINELVESTLKRISPIAMKKSVEMVFESVRPVAAQIDEMQFTIALNNLVENAIKYNKEHGYVRVSVNADHKYFYIKISDSGIGIPSEYMDKVFERFYRVDKARSRQTGGTGLGLSITKNIILLHKGTIKLYSKENEGTTFTVRVPLNYVGGTTI